MRGKNPVLVRDIINHLQTLPQDMEFRVASSEKKSAQFKEIKSIEITDLPDGEGRVWTGKAVVVIPK
jgi:hypothetical protein